MPSIERIILFISLPICILGDALALMRLNFSSQFGPFGLLLSMSTAESCWNNNGLVPAPAETAVP